MRFVTTGGNLEPAFGPTELFGKFAAIEAAVPMPCFWRSKDAEILIEYTSDSGRSGAAPIKRFGGKSLIPEKDLSTIERQSSESSLYTFLYSSRAFRAMALSSWSSPTNKPVRAARSFAFVDIFRTS